MKKLFKAQAAYLRQENKRLTAELVPVPIDHHADALPPGLIAAWRSNRFLVQLFAPENGGQRISINRAMVDEQTGRWVDGITWDEIQGIKRQVGFGDRHAVEIYPPDSDVINVANIRHIWLVDAPAFAWK